MLGRKGKMFLAVEHLWLAFYWLWFFKSITKPIGICLYVLYRKSTGPLIFPSVLCMYYVCITVLSVSTYHKFVTQMHSRNSEWGQAWDKLYLSAETNNFLAVILYTSCTCQFLVWIWSFNASRMEVCVPEAKLEAGHHCASWGTYPSWTRFQSVLIYKWAVST